MDLANTFHLLSSTGLSGEPYSIDITDEPKIPVYTCFPSNECYGRYDTEDVVGQGTHPSRLHAKTKSIAEFLERLCLFNPRPDLLSGPYMFADNGEFADPGTFSCYSEEQVGNSEAFSDNVRKKAYRWLKCHDYFKDSEIMVPAQVIYLAGVPDDYQILRESISTGAALGHVDESRAFDSGLLEALERDACIHSYLTRKKLSRVTGFHGEIDDLMNYLRRYHLEVYPFVVTNDLGVPTVMTVILDRTEIGPAVSVGSKAAFNYSDAVLSSILESIQCRGYARLMKNVEFPGGLPGEDEITTLRHRLFYWYPRERIEDIGFWLNDHETVEFRKLTKEATARKEALDRLHQRGFHLYVADITLPEIKHAGFHVLKVVIPELHPLYLGEQAKALYSVHHGSIPDDSKLKPHPLT